MFTVAIGNADAHGKNIALLHVAPGEIALAPLYDTVPTALWPRLRTDAAMFVGGRTDLRQISLDDVAAEARAWSLDSGRARVLAVDVCEQVLGVIESGGVDVDSPALDLVAARVRKLLRT